MNKLLLIGILLVVVGIGFYYYYSSSSTPTTTTPTTTTPTTTTPTTTTPPTTTTYPSIVNATLIHAALLEKGATLFVKYGAYLDGIWSSNTPKELTCQTTGLCSGGNLAEIPLTERIGRIDYTISTSGVIGQIKFTGESGALLGGKIFGLNQYGTYGPETIIQISGKTIRDIWINVDKKILEYNTF